MKTKKQRKFAHHLTLAIAAAVADLLWIPQTVHAQALSGSSLTVTGSTTLQGNVSITGTGSVLDFYGNSLYLGTAISGSTSQSGVSALYIDGNPSKFSLISARPAHQWTWESLQTSGSSALIMSLDGTNGLTVYDISGNSVVISPNTASGSGPNTLLTQQGADSRYVSSENFTVGSGTWWGGTGPTIALTGGTATGAFSFAGINAIASGYGSYANGVYSRASGDDSTASGYGANASGYGSYANGVYSRASGDVSNAGGYGSYASGYGSYASGVYSTASGVHSTASGYRSYASGYASIASGFCADVSGYGATASGFYSNAGGYGATASGFYSNAIGYGSEACGYRSTARGCFSTASGYMSNASAYGEFVTGQWNIPQGDPNNWVPTDDLFVIGNGSGEGYYDQQGNWQQSQSNALVVKKNGDTTVYGNLAVSGTANVVLIHPAGDLSMGDFTNGACPPKVDYASQFAP